VGTVPVWTVPVWTVPVNTARVDMPIGWVVSPIRGVVSSLVRGGALNQKALAKDFGGGCAKST